MFRLCSRKSSGVVSCFKKNRITCITPPKNKHVAAVHNHISPTCNLLKYGETLRHLLECSKWPPSNVGMAIAQYAMDLSLPLPETTRLESDVERFESPSLAAVFGEVFKLCHGFKYPSFHDVFIRAFQHKSKTRIDHCYIFLLNTWLDVQITHNWSNYASSLRIVEICQILDTIWLTPL